MEPCVLINVKYSIHPMPKTIFLLSLTFTLNVLSPVPNSKWQLTHTHTYNNNNRPAGGDHHNAPISLDFITHFIIQFYVLTISNPKYEIGNKDNVLRIKSVQRTDSGNYTCFVRNPSGNDHIVYMLIVQGEFSPKLYTIYPFSLIIYTQTIAHNFLHTFL